VKYRLTIAVCAALFLGLAASCGDSTVDAADLVDKAKDAAGDLDLEGLSPDALKGKAEDMIGSVTSGLGDIKDLASAEQIKEKLMPMLDKFGDLKGLLGDKLPDVSSLSTAVDTLKSKFAGNAEIMDALKPLLEKLTTFLK